MTEQNEILLELEKRRADVDYTIKLPATEADIMLAIWELDPPVTTGMLMEKIGRLREWKAPTLISFLSRLESRGYLFSYKNGKERYYLSVAERSRYVSETTKRFTETYHGGSFVCLLDAFFDGREFKDSDIDELLVWLKNRK